MPKVLVVDCSVAAKWVLPEPSRETAMRLLQQWESGTITLIAPDLLLAEFASMLAKRRRRKQISSGQATSAFGLMKQCSPRLYVMRPRLEAALEISLEHHLSLWDSVYIALAVEHGCDFLTADGRHFRGARHPVIQFLS